MKREYEKIRQAYEDVKETGYGIVMPDIDELTLEEPEIIRQGSKYGIRLKAAAPSIHLMRTQICTELTPIVGSEQQSEELVMYLLKEFEESPGKIWESNIFGKSLHELVNEGLHNKLYRMPDDARNKLRETIERIINDGCSVLICIILYSGRDCCYGWGKNAHAAPLSRSFLFPFGKTGRFQTGDCHSNRRLSADSAGSGTSPLYRRGTL